MNLNRTIAAALAIAALSTYQAWAIDVPSAPAEQGAQNATAPIQNQALPNTGANAGVNAGTRFEANPNLNTQQGVGANVQSSGAMQQGELNTRVQSQIPPPVNAGVNAAGTMQGNVAVTEHVITDNRADPWRYKFENNRWWYWTPENRWMIFSDQLGWTYPQVSGGYTTAYAPATAAPTVEYAVPSTTYYYNSYPGYGYYNYGYPRRFYFGRPGYYVGRPWWGVGRWWW
jgi:hypothetical protein